MTERDWQRRVVQAARDLGWWVYHTHDSRHSPAGLPDLLMIRGSALLWVELKRQTGRYAVLSQDQAAVRNRLLAAGQRWYLWRPSDWDTVLEVLR